MIVQKQIHRSRSEGSIPNLFRVKTEIINTTIGATYLPDEFQTIILSDKYFSSLLLVKCTQGCVLVTVPKKSQYSLHGPFQPYG